MKKTKANKNSSLDKKAWLQKLRSRITLWFVLEQIADVVLVTLFVLWIFGYINGVFFIAFFALYISVFIVKEIRKVKQMLTDAKSGRVR